MPSRGASPRSAARAIAPLRAIARLAVAHVGRRAGEIGIVLADDARLRELNRQWRGLDRTTDVLSFEYGEEAPESPRGRRPSGGNGALPPVNGDLVVSLDRVRVQARRYKVSEGRELARLTIHGALHLAGLDHDTAPRRAVMRRTERAVMRLVGRHVRALERALVRESA